MVREVAIVRAAHRREERPVLEVVTGAEDDGTVEGVARLPPSRFRKDIIDVAIAAARPVVARFAGVTVAAEDRRGSPERVFPQQVGELVTHHVEIAADDDRLRARNLLLDETCDGAKLRPLDRALLGVPSELRVGPDDVVAGGSLLDPRMDESLRGTAVGAGAIGVDHLARLGDRVFAGDENAAVLAEPAVPLPAPRRAAVGEALRIDPALLATPAGAAGAAQDRRRVAEALRPQPLQEQRACLVVIGLREDDDVVRRQEGRDEGGALLLAEREAFAEKGDVADMRGQQEDVEREDAEHLVRFRRRRSVVDPRALADARRRGARRQRQGQGEGGDPASRAGGPVRPAPRRGHVHRSGPTFRHGTRPRKTGSSASKKALPPAMVAQASGRRR